MLTTKEFIEKLINDLNHEFTKAFKYGDDIVIEWDAAKMNIPIETIFSEYQLGEDYEETLQTYKGITKKILGQHKFKIDYDNIFPLLKKNDFAKDSE